MWFHLTMFKNNICFVQRDSELQTRLSLVPVTNSTAHHTTTQGRECIAYGHVIKWRLCTRYVCPGPSGTRWLDPRVPGPTAFLTRMSHTRNIPHSRYRRGSNVLNGLIDTYIWAQRSLWQQRGGLQTSGLSV